ncbi:MAG TPA: TlpA disulfide reductase family protein [Polyangiaceae bacterium]|nr:TlpA disulfide reductase family protein [Polyangiaceae bacterium]
MRLRDRARAGASCAALVVGCGGAQTGGGAAPSTEASGATAPDFTARDVNGNTFRMSDHLGREVVLLDFWSTFCEPCKAEFPHLGAMYERERPRGLLVVGVSMDGPESVAEVPAFVKRYGIGFPVVIDEDSRIASLYDPKKSMPLSVLVSRSGRIAAVREGYNPGDEKLVEADVERALGEGSKAP